MAQEAYDYLKAGDPQAVGPSKPKYAGDDALKVRAAEAITAGDLVYLSGWNETDKVFAVTKADSDASGRRAQYIARAAISSGEMGMVYKHARLTAVNTGGSTVGNPIYLSTTAGAWTLTAPTGADDVVQIVGRVTVVHASTGEVEVNVADAMVTKVGTNEIQDDAIDSQHYAAGSIDAEHLSAKSVTGQKLSLEVINKTGSSIATDKLVAVSGLDTTSGKPKIVLADADVAAHEDVWVTTAAIANNAEGTVAKVALSAADLNTNSVSAAGDPVYLDVTAGAFAVTAPTGATARVHPVGMVVVKSATVGQILWKIGPVRKVGTDELQDASVTLVKVAAATLDGTVSKVVANANVIGGIPVIHRIDITAGALGDTDVVLTHKTRVVDAWLVLRGAGVATTTLQVKNGANAITDAMAASGSDKALVRAATIDDAYHEIAAAGTLRVTSATGATQPDATVYVVGMRVA